MLHLYERPPERRQPWPAELAAMLTSLSAAQQQASLWQMAGQEP